MQQAYTAALEVYRQAGGEPEPPAPRWPRARLEDVEAIVEAGAKLVQVIAAGVDEVVVPAIDAS
jgi:hypothetical protein